MEDWFGFTRTTSNYNKLNLANWIEQAIDDNSKVALLVNYDGLIGGIQGKVKDGSIINFPGHYIQPTKIEQMDDGKYKIEYWHWGATRPQILETSLFNLNKMTHDYGSWK